MGTPTSSLAPLPQYILQAGQNVGYGDCGWFGVQVSLFIAKCFSHQRLEHWVEGSMSHCLKLSLFSKLCGCYSQQWGPLVSFQSPSVQASAWVV